MTLLCYISPRKNTEIFEKKKLTVCPVIHLKAIKQAAKSGFQCRELEPGIRGGREFGRIRTIAGTYLEKQEVT